MLISYRSNVHGKDINCLFISGEIVLGKGNLIKNNSKKPCGKQAAHAIEHGVQAVMSLLTLKSYLKILLKLSILQIFNFVNVKKSEKELNFKFRKVTTLRIKFETTERGWRN